MKAPPETSAGAGRGRPESGLPDVVRRAAELTLERKARDVIALDLRSVSSATDHFLIATGTSDIQIRAIADHVVGELKKEGVRPDHVEGTGGGRWVLIDYIDLVVHVFHPDARAFYQLETLWGDTPRHEFDPDENGPARGTPAEELA